MHGHSCTFVMICLQCDMHVCGINKTRFNDSARNLLGQYYCTKVSTVGRITYLLAPSNYTVITLF